MLDEPVTVATFGDSFEANLAKARLEDAGIRALVTGDQIESTWHLSSTFTGVTLVVANSDLQAARKVLQDWPADDPGSSDSDETDDE